MTKAKSTTEPSVNTSDAATALETLPLRPLPHVEELELEAVSVTAPGQCNTAVDVLKLEGGRVGLLAMQCQGATVDSGGVRSLVARAVAEYHLQAGAQPHTALACVVEEMNARYPDNLLAGACVAILEPNENRVSYSSVGSLQPRWYHKTRRAFASKRELSSAHVQPLGASLDEVRVHLQRGDWFVLYTRGVTSVLSNRGAGVATLTRLLGNTSATGLVDRLARAARKGQAASSLRHDVAMFAVRVPPTSHRFSLLRKLGFRADDPVHLSSIRYFEEMDRAAAGVLKNMDRHGYRDAAIRKMKIALAELLVNALEHGNKKDSSKSVHIGYLVDGDTARIAIMDEGDGFDPSTLPDPTTAANVTRDRGRGVFLARHFVDKLFYNRVGNRVTAVKHFRDS